MSQIVRVFPETNLINGHLGLSKIAKDAKVDVNTLKDGEFLIFINKRQSAFKLYAAKQILVYYRHPKQHRMELQAIQYIPQIFQAKKRISYDEALTVLLKKKLTTK